MILRVYQNLQIHKRHNFKFYSRFVTLNYKIKNLFQILLNLISWKTECKKYFLKKIKIFYKKIKWLIQMNFLGTKNKVNGVDAQMLVSKILYLIVFQPFKFLKNWEAQRIGNLNLNLVTNKISIEYFLKIIKFDQMMK